MSIVGGTTVTVCKEYPLTGIWWGDVHLYSAKSVPFLRFFIDCNLCRIMQVIRRIGENGQLHHQHEGSFKEGPCWYKRLVHRERFFFLVSVDGTASH